MSSPKEIDEAVRLTELYQLDILDTSREEFFETLVDLGITAFNCAFCFIAFVDSERVWFKAKRGFEAREVPRDVSICSNTIKHDGPYVINDCAVHPDFKTNPLVTESPGIKAYLGVPLHSLNGKKIGSFCLVDSIPREWVDAEIAIANNLAKLAELSVIERAIKIKKSGENAGSAQHLSTSTQNLGSWKSIDHNNKIELSPSMEKWLHLIHSKSVSANWFNNLPIAEDRDKVAKARLERSGNSYTYRVQLPNNSVVIFEEQVYGSDQTGDVRLFGLVKKVSEPLAESSLRASEDAQTPRMDPGLDLKRFPRSFLKESVKGRMQLDYTGHITGLAGPDDKEFFKVKSKENLIELLHAEDQAVFLTLLNQSLRSKTPSEAWARLGEQEENNTWLRIELCPKKGFTAFRKPHFEANFTAMINKASSMQKSVFDETLLNLTGTLAKVGGWYYHLESGSLKTTEMLREVLGVSKESLTTIFHLSAIVSKLSGRNIAVLFIECINNRKPASLEFESQDNDNKWFRMMIRPSISEDGVPMGLYGSIADISESRKTELALEKNLLTYNLIVDNLTDGLVEIDATLNVSFVNRNAKALLQKDRELFVHALPLHELIPDLDMSQFSVLLESVDKAGFSKSVEHFVQFIKRWISIRIFKSGSGYTILIKDVTKRKNQSSDLYMLNSAIEQIREIVMVTNDIRKTKDPFGLLYVNSAFESFVGQGRDKWLGRNPYHLIHGRIPTKHYRQLLVAFLSRQKILLKTEYEINLSHKVPCDILISPFLDTARNAPCFLVVFRVLEI